MLHVTPVRTYTGIHCMCPQYVHIDACFMWPQYVHIDACFMWPQLNANNKHLLPSKMVHLFHCRIWDPDGKQLFQQLDYRTETTLAMVFVKVAPHSRTEIWSVCHHMWTLEIQWCTEIHYRAQQTSKPLELSELSKGSDTPSCTNVHNVYCIITVSCTYNTIIKFLGFK